MGAHDALAIVFTGGDPPDPHDLRGLAGVGAFVIAADSGLHHAQRHGFAVDVVVGDLDSVTSDALEAAKGAGATVVRHPADKDATDLELALLAARARGCTRVVVVGGGGGRLDHFLANAVLLAAASLAPLAVEARIGGTTITVVRDQAELIGAPGDVLTLLALGGPAAGVTTEGLQFPLHDETLESGSSRGVSNVFVTSVAHVLLRHGVLLAIQPRQELS